MMTYTLNVNLPISGFKPENDDCYLFQGNWEFVTYRATRAQ